VSSETRILLVEDNRDTLRLYKNALTRRSQQLQPAGTEKNIVIHTATDLIEAQSQLARELFELVVVDLRLPGSEESELGGLDVIHSALTLDPLCHVIVITAFGTTELARMSFRSGVFDFIQKGPDLLDELIAAAARALEHRRHQLVRAGNPFVPISSFDPPVMAGRASEVDLFFELVNRLRTAGVAEHFVVLGDWGLGKSTLLSHYRKLAHSTGNLAATIRLEPKSNDAELVHVATSLVEALIRDLPVPQSRLHKVASYFDSVGINILGSGIEFSRATDRQVSAFSVLHDTILNLWEDLKDHTGVFVLLIDDVHRLGVKPDILLVLQAVFSAEKIRRCRVLVGLASPAAYWREVTHRGGYDELSRFFRPTIDLAPLTGPEMRAAILATLRETGISFSTDIVDQVIASSQGHPYKLQLLCYHLFRNLMGTQVTIDVWPKALSDALDELADVSFRRTFDAVDPLGHDLLGLLIETDAPLRADQLIEQLGQRGIRTHSLLDVSAGLERLAGNGVLKHSGGAFHVADTLFRIYVKERLRP
jgi:CheY-like chemotaxis protein